MTKEKTQRARHPVVLLPGFMADGRIYEPVIRTLSPYVPVCVAPLFDQPCVEDAVALLIDQLPPRFTLVGADLGGVVAMEMLQRIPERICGLGLISATPLAESPAKAAEREPWIIRAKAGRLTGVMQEIFPTTSFVSQENRTYLADTIAQMAQALGSDRFVSQSRMMQRRSDYQSTLRKTQVPSLIICGRHDRENPVKRYNVMAELMGYARLEIIEDAGPLPLLETPDQVAQILSAWITQ